MMGDNNEMEMKRVSSVVYSQNKSCFLGGKYYRVWHTQLSPAELYKTPRYYDVAIITGSGIRHSRQLPSLPQG